MTEEIISIDPPESGLTFNFNITIDYEDESTEKQFYWSPMDEINEEHKSFLDPRFSYPSMTLEIESNEEPSITPIIKTEEEDAVLQLNSQDVYKIKRIGNRTLDDIISSGGTIELFMSYMVFSDLEDFDGGPGFRMSQTSEGLLTLSSGYYSSPLSENSLLTKVTESIKEVVLENEDTDSPIPSGVRMCSRMLILGKGHEILVKQWIADEPEPEEYERRYIDLFPFENGAIGFVNKSGETVFIFEIGIGLDGAKAPSLPNNIKTFDDFEIKEKILLDEKGKRFVIKKFESSGTFFTSKDIIVDVLIVGGGGAGQRGGGGAGGVLLGFNQMLSPGSHTIVVGAGGTSDNGENSVFNGSAAMGGGRGGRTTSGQRQGAAGGSGGGGAAYYGNHAGGAGESGQGHSGGRGHDTRPFFNGGGGGAGAVGGTGSTPNGGAGIDVSEHFGTEVGEGGFVGGGGAGSVNQASTTFSGGVGGGGSGSSAGLPNTGGGGGRAAAGGSGVVVIRFPI